jgi:phosphate transport system substrate-binding protein
MKKTRLSIALILLVAMSVALMVSGCAKDKPSTEPTMAPTEKPADAPTAEPAPAGLSGEFSFSGSTTVGKFMDAMIEAFQDANPDAAVSYEGTGSSAGIAALIDGTVTMAGSSREVKQAELDEGCVPTAVAMDGIAIIANNSVAVDDLTVAQLAGIFSGNVTKWSEVIDGAEGDIVVVNRDAASGTRATFMELVLEKALGKDPEPEFTTNATETNSNGNMVQTVNTTPGSIGYCGIGFLSELTDAKPVSVAGITPSIDTVMDGTYPISRYLYFVTMGEPGEGEQAFIDFCLSEEGQNIVEDVGGYIKLP